MPEKSKRYDTHDPEEIFRRIIDYRDKKPWLPESEITKQQIEDSKRKMEDHMWKILRDQQRHQPKAPIDVLREDMEKQLREIRKAIRKLGILLDSDEPTEEQLKKHKALRDAYRKYKMIEKLTLGGEAEDE